MARAAAALARRLMRQNGLTEDDLRDGPLPSDASIRIVMPCKNGEVERFVTVNKLVMTRWKTITTESRQSAISQNAIIYLRGAKDEVKPAERLWHWLNEMLVRYWQEEMEAKAVGNLVTSRLSRFFPMAMVRMPPPDEPSWLKGVVEGYWMAEHQDIRWRAALKDQEERRKELPTPKPKRRRRHLPRRNPLALAIIPKPPERKPEPSQDWKDCAQMHIVASKIHGLKARVTYQDEVDSPEPEPREKRRLDDFSYRRGFQLGRMIYDKLKEQ